MQKSVFCFSRRFAKIDMYGGGGISAGTRSADVVYAASDRAFILFKEETFGEAYTVSSAQNLTWGDVAELYTEIIGADFKWVSLEEYIKATDGFNYYALIYDRLFDRKIDNRKILKATGLKSDDFLSVAEGLKTELNLLKG